MPKIVDHEQRRQSIIDGMWTIVQRDGFSAVSVRSIAAEVGLSKSTIAHYFASQDEILAVAVQQHIDVNNAKFQALDVATCTPEVALKALLLAIPTTPEQRRQSQVWLALLEHSQSSPQVAETLAHMNREIRTAINALLQALATNGFVHKSRNLEQEAVKLHAIVDGLSLQSLTDSSGTAPALIRQTVALAIADLKAAPK